MATASSGGLLRSATAGHRAKPSRQATVPTRPVFTGMPANTAMRYSTPGYQTEPDVLRVVHGHSGAIASGADSAIWLRIEP